MTHHIFRRPLISTAVTASAIAAAAMLTAGCGPASSSAAGGTGTSAPGGASSAPASGGAPVSAPASGGGGAATAGASPSGGSGTGSGPGSGGSASGTPGTAQSNCTMDDLKVTLGGSQGAAGSLYMPIVFTNTSGGPCGIQGFPGVSLTNSGGVIGNPATRDRSQGSGAMITLAPGASASAQLRITQAENYPASSCHSASAADLQVYPPNLTASVDVPYKGTGCESKSVGLMQVQPLVSGSGS